jgi:hypothetical protein
LPGAIAQASADAAGFATVSIEGAGFAPGVTELKIRARPLASTTNPPLGGQFRVVDAETLVLRVPLYTPEGTYVMTARPDTDQLKRIEVELDVPAQVVIVEVVAGVANVVIDDAGFAAGVTTARIGDGAGTALVEVNTPTIGAGQFRVIGPEALRLRIPAGIPSGRHHLTLGRGPAQPDLELWLRVP